MRRLSTFVLVLLLGLAAAARPARPAPRRIDISERLDLLRDIEYGKVGDERSLHLDLVLPKRTPEEPMPVVVWIHGGAWRSGRRERGLGLLYPLALSGYAGAAVEYRLSGEATWPAQIEDCKAAIRFLRANAERYHLDPDRIGVWGASAGGHLAALLGTSGGVAELEGKGGFPEQSSRVQAVCDWFGPSDLTAPEMRSRARRAFPTESPIDMLLGGPLEQNLEAARQASPVSYVSEDDPPFLIMHGDKDRLVPLSQSRLLHGRLKEAGVDVELKVVQGAGHGFRPREVWDDVQGFFDARLRAGPEDEEAEPPD